MNKVFVFDLETTGLPPKDKFGKRLQLERDTFHLFPRAVQLCALLYNMENKTIETCVEDIVAVTDDVEISEEAVNIHHITKDMTKEKGIQINILLKKFFELITLADVIIAHNISFDADVIKTELYFLYQENPRLLKKYLDIVDKKIIEEGYCTKENTTKLCKLPFPNRKSSTAFKWPKLVELHQHLFGYIPDGLHDAKTDCLVCLKCYLKLIKKEDAYEEEEDCLSNEFRLLGI
jgi:DNA polymerase III epsilon subunit-like protein